MEFTQVTRPWPAHGHMEKQETEMKQKLEMELEMEMATKNTPIIGAS